MRDYFRKIVLGCINLIKGLIVTFKCLVSPAITVQYPKQRLPMVKRFRGSVDLRIDKCIMCYQCVKICPTGCLAIKHEVLPENKKRLQLFQYRAEYCCFCGLCEQVCPTEAIYMNKVYEFSTCERKQLNINLLDKDKYAKWPDPAVK